MTMRFLLLLCLLPLACGGADPEPEPETETETETESEADPLTHHEPRYGGDLVPLDGHSAHLEFVLDDAAGKLTMYVWDGHVSKSVRIKAKEVAITADLDDEEVALKLSAVANPLTGETVGDTSKFELTSERLRGSDGISGVLARIEIRGKLYKEVDFYAPIAEVDEEGQGDADEDG
ncbi:MAG: hypothetical protein ACE10D_09845 [Planctomycetota bacterium]